LIIVLPDNSSVNTVQQRNNKRSCVFHVLGDVTQQWIETTWCLFVDPTDTPIDWLDSYHVICVYCRSLSVSRLYKGVTKFVQGSYNGTDRGNCVY
jgi:hypothetical protein